MSQASWAGAKMVFHQISYESPALFIIFQAYFQERDFFKLEDAANQKGVSSEDFKKFICFIGGFYANMSNYHNFGATKFIPEISRQTFKQILLSNPLYHDNTACYKEVIDELYPQVEEEIFNIQKPYTQLNFPDEGGVTGYFSRNMTKADLAKVQAFCLSQNVNLLNTRAFKKEGTITVTVGSIDTFRTKRGIQFEDQNFDLVYGEFAPYI